MSEDYLLDFNEMTDADYEAIGFRAGLEIHQQLATSKKLFCRCPAPYPPYDDNYHTEIVRSMRLTPSELGIIDPSILMEHRIKKEIHYRVNRNNICTYELDQTPPFEINNEALDIALQICYLFNCKPVDEIFIQRKHLLDGSIPSGFQRTALVGVDGFVEFNNRKIKITQINIEEDSAREYSDFLHTRTFYTDRLGIPLIEIVTEPELRNPSEIKEFCELVRNYLITTGKVRTCSGAFRFDMNISIAGGNRIEIKATNSIKNAPIVAYYEVQRQYNLLQLRNKLHEAGITPEEFTFKTFNLCKILKDTNYYPIAKSLENGGEVHCVLLPKWAGFFKWTTQRYRVFSQEISDRVKVVACLTDMPNIIVSDIIDNTISREEIDKTQKYLGLDTKDAFVIVWGSSDDVKTAIDEIVLRAYDATRGIPSESRRALNDGTSSFERLLPEKYRLYPDTDLPSIVIKSTRLKKLRLTLTESYAERVQWCEQNNISKELTYKFATSTYYPIGKNITLDFGLEPNFVFNTLFNTISWLRKRSYDITKLTEKDVRHIYKLYKNKKIIEEGIKYAFELLLNGNGNKIEELLSPADENDIEIAFKIAKLNLKKMQIRNMDKLKEILIGLIMEQLRGRIKGKIVRDFVDLNWSQLNE